MMQLNDESIVKVKEVEGRENMENLNDSLVYEVQLCKLELKYDETCAILVKKIAENDRLHQAFAEGMGFFLQMLKALLSYKEVFSI